jgi:cell division protein FtsB
VAGAPEDGNPGRELGDAARQRAEARALAALLRGSGPQYPFPVEEIEEHPSEPEPPPVPEDAAEPTPPAEPGPGTEAEPPPRAPAVRRRRVGRLVGVLLALLFVVAAAIGGLGAWELARSRAQVNRLAGELRRAQAELGAVRQELQDLGADLRALADELPPDLPVLLDRVEPSVVAIRVRGKAAASGLAVEAPALPEGYRTAVLTRRWVARAATRGAAIAVIHERRSFRARVGEMDRENGLALLFVKANLPPLPWASTDGDGPKVGEFVAAIGLLGRQISVTTGVVTAVGPDAVRTDARLTRGSAGGPVVDGHGEAVGIARAGPAGLVTATLIEGACRKLLRC